MESKNEANIEYAEGSEKQTHTPREDDASSINSAAIGDDLPPGYVSTLEQSF
jgi:hypothetical protein